MAIRNQRMVSFSKNDTDIQKYLTDNEIAFSDYVKSLIREDMKKKQGCQVSEVIDKKELKEVIKEVLQEINIPIETDKVSDNKEDKMGDKAKNIMNTFDV